MRGMRESIEQEERDRVRRESEKRRDSGKWRKENVN